MKLTKELLKEMILKEMGETKSRHKPKYDMIIEILKGFHHESVAIMSGQNPMAQRPDGMNPTIVQMGNMRRKDNLEKEVRALGLEYIRIGGKFAGIFENSVLIYDPNQTNSSKETHRKFLDKIAMLNRNFQQWGFVGGRKFDDGIQPVMAFTMYQIDYKEKMFPNAYYISPEFEQTTEVLEHSQVPPQGDYSFDPTSGKRMSIPLKYNPRPQDQEDLPDEEREPRWQDRYYKTGYEI